MTVLNVVPGRGEEVTGLSWLNRFALYLFTVEDFLACLGHLVPLSEKIHPVLSAGRV